MNVAMLAEEHIERLGDVPLMIFEGREISNVQVRDNANRLANALGALGVGEGDVVAVSMSNCPEVFESFGGIYRIGGVVLPILFVLSEGECRFILEDSDAVAVITDAVMADKMLAASSGLDKVKHVIVVGGKDGERTLCYERLLHESSPRFEMVEKDPEDVAVLMYTSGTTGKPKGVMLTHHNLITSAESAYASNEVESPQVMLICLPMAHIYGVAAMNAALRSEYSEQRTVVMRWYDPEECMRLIEQHRVNTFPAVPTMYQLILNHPNADKYDMSSLEDCIAGAAPLPLELRRAFMQKFDCGMRQLYGLTESTGMGTIYRPRDEWREGAVGRAYDNMELEIFDEDDNELGPREIGEVVIRGLQVMKGYHKHPEDTLEAMRGGWLHTGDVGYLDEEGFLYLTDRIKDIIIKGGENVMPTQIEEEIYKHPAVAEAAVIGIADPDYGEEIIAYVALKPGVEATPDEIMEHCRSTLPTFKQPREVRILEVLPKSSIGKILKRELRLEL